MILKNLTRKRTGTRALVRYIFRYMLQAEKTGASKQKNNSKPFIIRHNMKSKTIEGFITEFENNLILRKRKAKNQTIIHHTILSWSHKDANQITDTKLRAIARKFIQLRGEANLYAGTKHIDRNHIHLHIAVSGNQVNGRSSRLSQKAFADLKKNLDVFQRQKFPELAHSLPRHGLSKERRRIAKDENVSEQKEESLKGITRETEELTDIQNIRKRSKQKEREHERERELPVISPFQQSPFGEIAAGGILSPIDTSPG